MVKVASQNPNSNGQCSDTVSPNPNRLKVLRQLTGNGDEALLLYRLIWRLEFQQRDCGGYSYSHKQWEDDTGIPARNIRECFRRMRAKSLVTIRTGDSRYNKTTAKPTPKVCEAVFGKGTHHVKLRGKSTATLSFSKGTDHVKLNSSKGTDHVACKEKNITNKEKYKGEMVASDSLSGSKKLKKEKHGVKGNGEKGPKKGPMNAQKNMPAAIGPNDQEIYAAYRRGMERSGNPLLVNLSPAEKKLLKTTFARLPETVSEAVRLGVLEEIVTHWHHIRYEIKDAKWEDYKIDTVCSPPQLAQHDHLEIACRSSKLPLQLRLQLRGVEVAENVTQAQLDSLADAMSTAKCVEKPMTNADIEAYLASGKTKVKKGFSAEQWLAEIEADSASGNTNAKDGFMTVDEWLAKKGLEGDAEKKSEAE